MKSGLQSLKVALCAYGRHSAQVTGAGEARSDLFLSCVGVSLSFFCPFLVIENKYWQYTEKSKMVTFKEIQKRQCDKDNVKNGYI